MLIEYVMKIAVGALCQVVIYPQEMQCGTKTSCTLALISIVAAFWNVVVGVN